MDFTTELQAAALSWLDSGTMARLIVDDAFHILWANKAAITALKNNQFFENRQGVLASINGAGMVVLEAEIIKLRDDDVFVHPFLVDDTVNLIVVIRVLQSSLLDGRLYGIELRRPNAAEATQYVGYQTYFGFTKAEDRVLQQLLNGNNVDKCAEALNISIDTVRSHIRQLYSKMNISSREALFKAMLPFGVH